MPNVRETYGAMGYVDEQGNQSIHYPITQAELVSFDNAASGLNSTDAQGAIDELADWLEKKSADVDLAVGLLGNAVRQNTFEIERGTISLTNSAIYPVNNSATSVALAVERESGSYTVLTEVVSCSGNVGEIEITDKLANGFKIGYTGSATAAVVKYTVIGGYLK